TKRSVLLPDDLAAQLLIAAARAYPKEACGLVEGTDSQQGWIVTALHETANLAENPVRHFLIDPQMQFDLMRGLRGKDSRIIGCFHSHPNGVAEPSATDRAEAYETDFLYLIAGGAPDAGFTLRAYVFCDVDGFAAIGVQSA